MQKKSNISDPKWFIVPYSRGIVMQIGGDQPLYGHFLLTDTVEIIADGKLDALVINGAEILESNTFEDWRRVIKPDGYIIFVNQDETEAKNILSVWSDCVIAKQRDQLLVVTPNKKEKQKPKPDKSCLVVRYGAWGDQIICAGIFPLLKKQGYHVTLNCQAPQHVINATHPDIDELMVQDRNQVHNDDLVTYWQAIATEYDKVVNLSSSIEGQLLLSHEHPKYFWSQSARHKLFNQNYMEITHDLADVPYNFRGCVFHATADEKEQAKEIRQRFDAPLVTWAVAGSSVHKWYPHMADVLVGLLEQTNAYVMLMGDKEAMVLQESVLEETEKRYGSVERIAAQCGTLPMRASMALAQVSDVVVGPETGLLNAVCMEKNHKVVIVSHSGPKQLTKHWKNTKEILPQNTACFPCHRLHFDFEHCNQDDNTKAARCSASIEPATIIKAIKNGLHNASRK